MLHCVLICNIRCTDADKSITGYKNICQSVSRGAAKPSKTLFSFNHNESLQKVLNTVTFNLVVSFNTVFTELNGCLAVPIYFTDRILFGCTDNFFTS